MLFSRWLRLLFSFCELSTQVWEIEEPLTVFHLLEDADTEDLFWRQAWTRELGSRIALSVEGLSASLPKSTEAHTLGAFITMDISLLLPQLNLENWISFNLQTQPCYAL